MGLYPDYFRAEVRNVAELTPNMTRIVFGGDDLRRFVSSGDPDERLVLVPPEPGEHQTTAPVRLPDGTLDYPAGDEPEMRGYPEIRSYTVRRFDPGSGEMTVDVVRHVGGVAASWAIRAEVGDVVYLSPAKGWYAPPGDTRWQLLLADMTGLPALGRILEELPSGARAIAVTETTDHADRQRIDSEADVTCTWLPGSGNGHGPSRLLETLRRTALPDGPGYLWFAGEASASRAVRKYVRHELRWCDSRSTIIGYWRADQESWLARYQRVGAGLEQLYADAIASGLSEGDALDVYDQALEQAGL